jgi:hypothetical protein
MSGRAGRIALVRAVGPGNSGNSNSGLTCASVQECPPNACRRHGRDPASSPRLNAARSVMPSAARVSLPPSSRSIAHTTASTRAPDSRRARHPLRHAPAEVTTSSTPTTRIPRTDPPSTILRVPVGCVNPVTQFCREIRGGRSPTRRRQRQARRGFIRQSELDRCCAKRVQPTMQAGAVGAVGNVSGSPAGPGSSPDRAGAYSVRPTSRNVRVPTGRQARFACKSAVTNLRTLRARALAGSRPCSLPLDEMPKPAGGKTLK